VLFVTPSIDPKLGQYSFEEIIRAVHHQFGLELTEKQLRTRITKNVSTELNPILKAFPLFIKNPVMWTIYRVVGERASSLTISNLGNVTLPDEMKPYVTGVDFVLGIQSILPYSSAAVSSTANCASPLPAVSQNPCWSECSSPSCVPKGSAQKSAVTDLCIV
jgi:hypothetical protein